MGNSNGKTGKGRECPVAKNIKKKVSQAKGASGSVVNKGPTKRKAMGDVQEETAKSKHDTSEKKGMDVGSVHPAAAGQDPTPRDAATPSDKVDCHNESPLKQQDLFSNDGGPKKRKRKRKRKRADAAVLETTDAAVLETAGCNRLSTPHPMAKPESKSLKKGSRAAQESGGTALTVPKGSSQLNAPNSKDAKKQKKNKQVKSKKAIAKEKAKKAAHVFGGNKKVH